MTSQKLEDASKTPEEYEKQRQRIFSKSLLPSESQLSSIESAIDEVSGVHPLLALEIEDILRLIIKQKNIKLSESASNIPLYSLLSATHESGIKACIESLGRVIKVLAFKHGVFTYLQIVSYVKKISKVDGKLADFIINGVKAAQTS